MFQRYMCTIYEMTVPVVTWKKFELSLGKVRVVLGKACESSGADGVGVSGAEGAELHWPLTKIMWCHFNLTSGLFFFFPHTAPFSSGFALSPRRQGRRGGGGVGAETCCSPGNRLGASGTTFLLHVVRFRKKSTGGGVEHQLCGNVPFNHLWDGSYC